MPVITAAGLAKRIGDRTLFADLSFKLDRRERMTLAGRNGSGKTTLLRMLASEIGTDAGRIVLGKGVRVALHDQRPPRTDATLREYVTAGLAWIGEIEAELSALEAAHGGGRSDPATLSAYADAQARLEHAGGYRWRDGIDVALRGLGFVESELDRPLVDLLGR